MIWDLAPGAPPAGTPLGVQHVSAAEMRASAARLHAVLRDLGIDVLPKSWIGRALRVIADVPIASHGRIRISDLSDAGRRELIERDQLCGDLAIVARLVCEALPTMGDAITVRLRDLAGGDHSVTRDGPSTDERNRVFELLAAAWLRRFASGVQLAEPDIRCQFEGRSWGIACKAAYGTARTVAKRIHEGARQARDSGAEHGAVLVCLTSIFPHGLVPTYTPDGGAIRSYATPEQAYQAIQKLVQPIATNVAGHLRTIMAGPHWRCPTFRGAALVGNTRAFLHLPGGAATTMVPICQPIEASKELEDLALKLHFAQVF